VKRKPAPSYVIHSATRRGRLVWYNHLGERKQKLLPGQFGSKESLAAKARLELELATAPTRSTDHCGMTINEMFLAYIEHAEQHYRGPDGNPTDETRHLRTVSRLVRELYGHLAAAEFGPLALKAVRQKFVDLKWCRKTVNARVERIRRMFKWAVAEELVPPATYQALAAVSGLQRGRSTARETEPIGPVDDAVVDATLPYLNRHVAGLVELQRLTGCRPGEACAIRRCDIDTGGAVWLYKPTRHKTAHRGKSRIIAIGPKAQEALRPFLAPDLEAYLFSPSRAVEELNAERSANRQTPRYPSHMKRNETKRKGTNRERPPAEKYDRGSYELAVDRACDRAFPPAAPLAQREGETVAEWWGKWVGKGKNKRWIPGRLTEKQRAEVKAWRKAHRWSPNQLRHTFATRVRKAHGLEAAQVLLGHSRADVTQVYAERNEELAVSVAAKIG
jgi:integrase